MSYFSRLLNSCLEAFLAIKGKIYKTYDNAKQTKKHACHRLVNEIASRTRLFARPALRQGIISITNEINISPKHSFYRHYTDVPIRFKGLYSTLFI